VITNLYGATTSAVAALTVNTAPRLAALGQKLVRQGSVLTFRAAAVDTDLPPQTLTYSLDAGAPAGASLEPLTGLFFWTPGATEPTNTHRVTIRATDNGFPPLSDIQ